MRINCPPCAHNAFAIQRIAYSSISNVYRPAGSKIPSYHPLATTHLSCTPLPVDHYQLLSTSTSVSYHISSSGSFMTRTGGTSTNARTTTSNYQGTTQRVRTYSQSQSRRTSVYRTSVHGSSATLHLSWLFRSNIPSRRSTPLPADIQKRNFFGAREVIGVLANPSETLRSLTESKRMLEETRRELAEARERAQLSPPHTFGPLPNFFDRPAELAAIEMALKGDPSFTILFGASSVGKTALLRQVLTKPKYRVLHFDLRIAGFADLASLYMSVSQQMEAFFMGIAQDPELPGYEEFEKQAWGFKHDRLSVERRLSNGANADGPGIGAPSDIKTSDIARLMELFQSSLLKYWNFVPKLSQSKESDIDTSSERTRVQAERKTARMRMFWLPKKRLDKAAEQKCNPRGAAEKPSADGKPTTPPTKKMPVFFIDEAHKLPALIRSTDAMKCLLDAMLVITKQDRLCHVIHATSDPFYQTWLRQLNVMQHCKIITIGDYPKRDTRKYFRETLMPNVPQQLRPGLDFERLYDAFGGKVAHWQDYITDYINANGRLDIKQSSHFLQAHSLLNLQVIHAAQAPPPGEEEAGPTSPRQSNPAEPIGNHTQANGNHNPSQPNLLQRTPSHAPLTSGTGFRIYSPLTINANPRDSPTAFTPAGMGSDTAAEFTAIQLLKVMNRLAQPGARALSYFHLCREMGARAIDGMIRGRILDLRWTDPVSREGWDPRVMSMRVRESLHANRIPGAGSSGTMVNDMIDPSEEGEMIALSDDELFREEQRAMELQGVEEEEEIVGPKLVPTTPIMRYAMREVVQEYYDDDDRTVSEYASLSEVEEY